MNVPRDVLHQGIVVLLSSGTQLTGELINTNPPDFELCNATIGSIHVSMHAVVAWWLESQPPAVVEPTEKPKPKRLTKRSKK